MSVKHALGSILHTHTVGVIIKRVLYSSRYRIPTLLGTEEQKKQTNEALTFAVCTRFRPTCCRDALRRGGASGALLLAVRSPAWSLRSRLYGSDVPLAAGA